MGLDFSGGMLKVSRDKTVAHPNTCLVQADAAELPFTSGSFDAVTCTHAFYELKDASQEKALREIVRVLKPGKAFFMVEHDLPENAFIRILYYLRLASMGLNKAKQILKNETDILGQHFVTVKKITVPPTGRSKVLQCHV